MLKETAEYTIHAPPPPLPSMRGNFFSKCKSFFFKIQAKSKPRTLGNQEKDIFCDLKFSQA
jgi:hypothetical protein